jgi:lipid A 4'-phosphatase
MLAPKISFGQEGHWDAYETAEHSVVSAHAMIKGALSVGAAALVLFLVAPSLDTTIAHIFYDGEHQFIGNRSPAFLASRDFFNAVLYLTCTATVIGLFVTWRSAGPRLVFNKWLFLALCLFVGPLVVTNIGLKDHWGRARPRDVIEFGGEKAFTPVFPPSNQCGHNCSFVSGEASSIYVIFFAAAFLLRRHARKMIALGVIFGSFAGLTRIAQGGHFLSDVVFAGIFMALTVACLQLLFDTIRSADGAEIAEPVA